jgi:carbon-monoxide dehydrogenase large subunit
MNAPTPSSSERTAKLEGLGCARKRVEDARFTQGKGNYVDDIKLPGMLFGDLVRSPYGHARIKRIDKEAALKVPGVKAILTAADLKPLNLHYMPTLAGDVQAVLADEKVLFQNQEVAFVRVFNFYNTDLESVIESLNEVYETKIRLADPAIESCRLNVTFKGEPIEIIAEIIAETLSLKITKSDTEIILDGSGCVQ